MPKFVSPEGNLEIWDKKPKGYYSIEEWKSSQPQNNPTEEELFQQRISEIQQKLKKNDLASVRPLRAKVAGTATQEDEDRLMELEVEAKALREELATLTA